WLYVGTAFCFFAAMMLVIVFVAREKSEARAEGGKPPPPTATVGPPVSAGDPAAGKQLFVMNGCGQCHTFKPAGPSANGTQGPELDNLAADAKKANRGSVETYAFES